MYLRPAEWILDLCPPATGRSPNQTPYPCPPSPTTRTLQPPNATYPFVEVHEDYIVVCKQAHWTFYDGPRTVQLVDSVGGMVGYLERGKTQANIYSRGHWESACKELYNACFDLAKNYEEWFPGSEDARTAVLQIFDVWPQIASQLKQPS